MPTKSAEERHTAQVFVDRLMKRQEHVPKGWISRVAEKTSIDITTLSHFAKGRRLPTTYQMLAIAGALDAPELVPDSLAEIARSGRAAPLNVRPVINPGATPIPASLRSYFDGHPDLHPAVKWELEQNHDQRTPEYVVKDDAFWERLARAWADILGVAGGPYQKRGENRPEAPRSRKG